MMTAKARSSLSSTKLNMLFIEINSIFGHAKELILKAYNLAIQENYSPQQVKQLLLDNITEFKKTQIYTYLPSECKNPVKQKAGYLSHKTEVSVPKSELLLIKLHKTMLMTHIKRFSRTKPVRRKVMF